MPKKAHKLKITKTQAKIINKKNFGNEPEFTEGHIFTQIDRLNTINWYNVMCTNDDSLEWLKEYCKRDKELFEKYKNANTKFISITAGFIARIIMRGYVWSPTQDLFIRKSLDDAARIKNTVDMPESNTVPEVVMAKPGFNPTQAHREVVSNIIGDIEAMIDKNELKSIIEVFKTSNIPPKTAAMVKEYYEPIADELIDLLDGKDKQLVEGYSHLSKAKQKELSNFYNNLVNDIDDYCSETKRIRQSVRKPRKKKEVSLDKKLSTFKYQPESKEFSISSVDPKRILGATELWTFNTKYKNLSVFRSEKGLDIKGTTILNYDGSRSFSKKIGVRTQERLNIVLNGSKVDLRKIFDTINTDYIKFVDRTSENTILLKVVK